MISSYSMILQVPHKNYPNNESYGKLLYSITANLRNHSPQVPRFGSQVPKAGSQVPKAGSQVPQTNS
jgi:hypothetical protein